MGYGAGSTTITEVTLDDTEEIMRRLPEGLTPSPAVGAQFARLLKLAIYPLHIIEARPIAAGFLPHRRQRQGAAALHPDEDRRLLECAEVPVAFRLLWGFLTREGMREGDAMSLTWADLLKRGAVRLDKNKTNDPARGSSTRTWRRRCAGSSGWGRLALDAMLPR